MIREITVLSGKGGTGKTTVTAALAALAKTTVFSDCDVDAADLHLLLHPEIIEAYPFESGWKVSIDKDVCTSCGMCAEACRFNAIHLHHGSFVVDPYQCEGCRLCERICPVSAITSQRSMNNFWYVSDTRFGPLVHAQMGPGEENSGKLVTTVRKKAKEIAEDLNFSLILNDGPPGIGCPVISSITGVDTVVMITEPSSSGLHDVERLVGLTGKFNLETFAVINKYDLHPEMGRKIEKKLATLGVPLIAKIPFDENMVNSMVWGKTIIEFDPNAESTRILRGIWETITK